jgi:hypothetical protein
MIIVANAETPAFVPKLRLTPPPRLAHVVRPNALDAAIVHVILVLAVLAKMFASATASAHAPKL